MTTTQAEITETLESMGLSLNATFIPWSQSRNRDEKTRSLNWIVILKREGKRAISTEYMQGIAHIPGYDQGKARIWDYVESYHDTCETGKIRGLKAIPKPSLLDVVHCLLLDSSVLDYSTFEEWASEFGYDQDSRKGENVYRECLKMALQFKQMFSAKERESLQELFQDY